MKKVLDNKNSYLTLSLPKVTLYLLYCIDHDDCDYKILLKILKAS